jgi:hypothetical protein
VTSGESTAVPTLQLTLTVTPESAIDTGARTDDPMCEASSLGRSCDMASATMTNSSPPMR